MYGPKGVGRSGFGSFLAKKRADEAASASAESASPIAPASPVVAAGEAAPDAGTTAAPPSDDRPPVPLPARP